MLSISYLGFTHGDINAETRSKNPGATRALCGSESRQVNILSRRKSVSSRGGLWIGPIFLLVS